MMLVEIGRCGAVFFCSTLCSLEALTNLKLELNLAVQHVNMPVIFFEINYF